MSAAADSNANAAAAANANSPAPAQSVTSNLVGLSWDEAYELCHVVWKPRFLQAADQLEGFRETRFKIGFDKVPYCATPIPGFNYGEAVSLEVFALVYPFFKQTPFVTLTRKDDAKGTYISAKTLPYEGYTGPDFSWSATSEGNHAKNFVNINVPGKFVKSSSLWKKTIAASLSDKDLEYYRVKDARDKHRLVHSGIIANMPPTTLEDEKSILKFIEVGEKFHPRVKKNIKNPQYGDSLGLGVSTEMDGRKSNFDTKVYIKGPDGVYVPTFTNALVDHITFQAIVSLDPWMESSGKYSSCINLKSVFITSGGNSGVDENVGVAQKMFGIKVDTSVGPTDVRLIAAGEVSNGKRKREDEYDGIVEMPETKVPLLTQS